MVKQASTVTCTCGQPIEFPEGEIKFVHDCGAVWVCGPEGFWYTEVPELAPILAKPKAVKVYLREQKYANYPKSRRKKRRGRR